jgi:hypothetical protein
MEIPDEFVVIEGVDIKEVDAAIATVTKDVGVKPTKVVSGKGAIAVCYRPWVLPVFFEALLAL